MIDASTYCPNGFTMRLSQCLGYAPGMRRPHFSLVIWIQLEHGQDRTRFHLEQVYASGVCAADETPLGFPNCLSKKKGYAPGMRQPHSSLAIWIKTRPGSCWNHSGARVCVRGVRWSSHALSVAKVPLDKNKYALSMRWPHSSLGKGIHAEHGLDSAKTLVSLRYLCAGGMRPIYIYAG